MGLAGSEVVATEWRDEVIHGSECARVCVEQLKLPAQGAFPPLAVERTCLEGHEDGPPVILVHGFAQNRYSWRVSRRSFSAFLAARGFVVLNLELRGHGRSRAYGAPSPRSFTEYVDDLVRVVSACDTLPFVIGHSLGGGVGVGAATMVPIAGLVQLAGVYTFAEENAWLRTVGRAFLGVERPLRAIPVRMSTRWFGSLVARVVYGADLSMYFQPCAGWVPGSVERDLIQERVRLGFDWISVEIWLEMAKWAQGQSFLYRDAFRQTDVPLLVLVGDKDRLLSPTDARICYDESCSTDKQFVLFSRDTHEVHWGHLDIILGKRAREIVWPVIADWMRERGHT